MRCSLRVLVNEDIRLGVMLKVIGQRQVNIWRKLVRMSISVRGMMIFRRLHIFSFDF